MTTRSATAPAVTDTIPGHDPLHVDLERCSHRQVVDETRGAGAVLTLIPTLDRPPCDALEMAARLGALCQGGAAPDCFAGDGHQVDRWLTRPHRELIGADLEAVLGVFGFTDRGRRSLLVVGIVSKMGHDVRTLAAIEPQAVFAAFGTDRIPASRGARADTARHVVPPHGADR